MGSSIAWFSTQVRRTASSARVSRLSVLMTMIYVTAISNKMSIVNFFDISKKDISVMILKKTEQKTPKKIRECSGSCEANPGDVFVEGLNDSSYRDILFNCLKELEEKAVKI